MRQKGWMVLAALCVVLVGCSRIDDAFMSVPAKVNAAYPVSPEVRLARERLDALLSDDAKALADLDAIAEAQLTIRALACSKGHVIERFTSVESIKTLQLERTCFQQQDQDLLDLFGIRTVGALLVKPPLKPKRELGPSSLVPSGGLSVVLDGVVASEANVAVFLDSQGQGVVVDLAEGAPMAELPRIGSISNGSVNISPNGRVVAINVLRGGPIFIDAETGSQIWAVSGRDARRMLAWLPEVTGWVMTTQEGAVLLVDGLQGAYKQHPRMIKNASYAANIPGQSSRLLLGTTLDFALISHERTGEGIQASVVKQYSLRPPGISSGRLIPMKNGKWVVFSSHPELGWLDLESGEHGLWRVSPMFYLAPVKLDETHLMMDSGELKNRPSFTWKFDIEEEVISQLSNGLRTGLLTSLGERPGFMRRSRETKMGDVAEPEAGGASLTLSEAVADYQLQIQLAKLEALSRAAESEAAHEALRDRTERVHGMSPMASPTEALQGVPKDAEVHVIGVYGGRLRNVPVGRMKQPVQVTVRPTSRPVILVLASHEPVNWIVWGAESNIVAVLMSGAEASSLGRSFGVPVKRIGSISAYSSGSSEYLRLRQAVTQYIGPREFKSFQGAYSGSEFTVGNAR